MKTYTEFFAESFKNAIGPNDPLKTKYVDQVWSVLQGSYKAIGGIKGSGFESKESMIKNIPFWKMDICNGKVTAVTLYKDKGGRKSVAAGTDGSVRGKTKIVDMMKNELQRSFGEKSKGALGLMLKLYPEDVIEPFITKPAQAEKILKKTVTPVAKMNIEDIPTDGQTMIQKYPFVKKYAYLRDLAGKPTFKVMLGTPGMKIKI